MAQHWEDWSGYSDGDDPTVDGDAGWTERWHASSVGYAIVATTNPAGSANVLRITTGGSNNRAFLSFDAVDSDGDRATAKVRVLMRINTVASNSSICGPAARGSGGTSSETAVTAPAGLDGSSTEEIRLVTYNNATGAQPDQDGTDAWAEDVWFWAGLDVDGTNGTATIRTEGTPATPVATASSTSLPVTAAGWVGLFSFSDGNTIDIAAVSVATGTDDEFFEDPSSDTTAPVLTSPTDTANGATAGDGSVTTDEGNGTLYWVVTQSATSPSVAQIQAGQDHTGSAADDSGSQSVSATGVQNASATGLTASTTYYFHFQHQDAATNDSTASSADGFTTTSGDGTAPILSSATATEASATSADISVSTDEGNGTLYWVVTTSASAPSGPQIQAGQDHTGSAAAASGNQAVSATGVQNVTATGLTTETTYYAHFQQEDAAANDSTVASSSAFAPFSETTGLTDDFDSALGTVGTISSEFTASPAITLLPDDQADVSGWQTGYWRLSGVDGKTPSFTLNTSGWRNSTAPVSPWGMVWRYVDDATVPADGRPRDWSLFDSDSGTTSRSFSNSGAFTQDNIEIAFAPRWRYLDTQRAFDYVAAHSYFTETASSAAFGGDNHVHAQIAVTTGANSAAGATLDYHSALLDNTASQPAGGEDKLNVVMLYGHHAGEDTGDFAFWEMVYGYTDGVGTAWDWFRQHCRLYLYDVNNAGRYYGKERWTEETGGDEDPNREWDDINSTQVNAVRSAVQADVSRVDVWLDFHVWWNLNGNNWSEEVGIYYDGTRQVNVDYKDRLDTAISPTSLRVIGTTAVAGTSIKWAEDNTDVQPSITLEFPLAMDSGYPSQESQFTTLMGEYVSALEAMVDNSELTLTTLTSTVTVTSAALAAGSTGFFANAEREVTSTSLLTAAAATLAGVAQREITSGAALTAATSTVSGSSDPVTNVLSANLSAQAAAVGGTAERVVTGGGSLVGLAPTVNANVGTTQNLTSSGVLESRVSRVNATVGINGEFPSRGSFPSMEISTSRQH